MPHALRGSYNVIEIRAHVEVLRVVSKAINEPGLDRAELHAIRVSDPGEARLFKFSVGGAAMSKDEVQRLIALGKVLAKKPVAKVSIEGFGDRPGTEPLTVGIAKHRAKVAQMLLAKAGVTEDRVTLAFVDMGSDSRLAQMIRVTTLPPLSEIEKP